MVSTALFGFAVLGASACSDDNASTPPIDAPTRTVDAPTNSTATVDAPTTSTADGGVQPDANVTTLP